MNDAALRRRIKLAALTAPAAPWLEDRVMAAVATDASRGVERKQALPWRRGIAAIAAVVFAALIVGILIGSRLAGGSVAPAGAPARDAASVGYASMVNRDMFAIDRDYSRNFDCKSRTDCTDQLLQMRDDTGALLADLAATPAPHGESASADRLRMAAELFVKQLDQAIAAVEQPGSDYFRASSAPALDQLDLAAAGVECWPVAAVMGEHGVECKT